MGSPEFYSSDNANPLYTLSNKEVSDTKSPMDYSISLSSVIPAAPAMPPAANVEVPQITDPLVPPEMPLPPVFPFTAPSHCQLPMLTTLVDILHTIADN